MSQRLERSEALNDWNVLNGLRYYLAIERLEHLEQAQAQLALWFVEYRDASVATVNNVVCVTALLPSGSSRHEAPLTRVEEAYQRKVACPLFSPLEHFLTTATCTITVANDLASHAPSENEVSKHRKHIPTVIYFAALLTNLLLSSSLHGAEPSPAAQTEWSNALKKAYEEGQLTVYGSTKYDLLFAEFQKQYPQIKVTVSTTRGSDVISRLMAERRADRYLVDLHLGSANASYLLYKAKIVDRLKPALMLAEITDESKWWGARHRYLDSEREYIFSFDGEAQMLFAYNTNLVNPNDLKSLWDFLDPKWKGRIVGLDPTNPIGIGVGLRFLYYNPDLGAPFLRKLLGEMELAASRDTRQIGDWLAVGNYALSVFTDPTRTGLDVAKKQGLPVDWFGPKAFREGVPLSSSTGNVALMDKAPHPAAARIAINWLLSRNGQSAYQRVFKEPDSLRIDVPKDAVPPESRRTADAKYVDIDRADRMDMEPIFKIVDEVWKKGKRG